MARALLIVDVQNDFVEGGALGVTGGTAVAAAIARHVAAAGGRYELVAASRDWHRGDGDNGGHFAAAGAAPDFSSTWPVHCVQGGHGAEYAPELDVSAIDVHVRKGDGEPAYSAFEGRLEDGSRLADALAAAGVDAVDVAGIATDHCVLASARDALAAGLGVRVLTDLVAGVAPESSRAALAELEAAGAVLVPSTEA